MAGRRLKKKPKLRHESIDESSPPWADLPPEIVSLIFKNLQIPDLLSSLSVCRSWSQAEPHGDPPQQIPWLMLSLRPNSTSQRFFSVSDRKIHRLTLNKNASGAVCCGSYNNWLVLSHWIHGDFLLNPFKDSIIPIELRSCLPQHFLLDCHGENDPFLIRKVILSNSPHDASNELNPCTIAAIFDQSTLVISNLNARNWLVGRDFPKFEDIIFHGEYLLAINHQEMLFVVEINHQEMQLSHVRDLNIKKMKMQSRLNHSYELDYQKHIYMVPSCINGALFMVLRYMKRQINSGPKTCFFKVYKLSCKSNPKIGTWREKEDLNGEAIFVSKSGSRAIRASEKSGFEGNCIYFLDDLENLRVTCGIHACDDMGVYHMKDGSIEKLIQNRPDSSLSPPAWFFLSNNFSDY